MIENKYIEKSLYKANGYIFQLIPKSSGYVVVLCRSNGKKFISLFMSKVKFEQTGFKLKDRVKVRFKIESHFNEQYNSWLNSMTIVAMEHWRVNEEKLIRKEKAEKNIKERFDERERGKNMGFNFAFVD